MYRFIMIDTPVLRHLAKTGKLGDLIAKQVPEGFLLLMRDGLDEDVLKAQRGGPRTFRRLDSLCSYLNQLGVEHFRVELTDYGAQELLNL